MKSNNKVKYNMRNYITLNLLILLVITDISISCAETTKSTSGNLEKSSNYDKIAIKKIYEDTTLIVLYKNTTNSKTILELEKKLPQHNKKSLNSDIIFLYQFSTAENLATAKFILENETIVNKISKDKIRIFNPEPGGKHYN